jgi:hypothetical protein
MNKEVDVTVADGTNPQKASKAGMEYQTIVTPLLCAACAFCRQMMGCDFRFSSMPHCFPCQMSQLSWCDSWVSPSFAFLQLMDWI